MRHAPMLLPAGRGEALKRFLVELVSYGANDNRWVACRGGRRTWVSEPATRARICEGKCRVDSVLVRSKGLGL